MDGDYAQTNRPLLRNGTANHAKSPERSRGKSCQSLAKWALKIVMWTVFLAWIALFFLVPNGTGTDLYNDWVDATEGTLYGSTGSTLLFYSGPILLIAVLAVPYLLISGSQEEQLQPHEKKEKARFRLGTFPVLVDGPFGVVSAGELIGIVLFVVFVLWAVYSYTVTNFEMLPTYGSLTPLEKRVQMLQMSAYMFGLTAATCLAFLFLPVARGSILLRLVDIPFEHATRYHVWLGNLTLFLLTLHGLCYFIVWFIRGIVLESIVEWKSDGGANFAGIIAYSFGFIMWVTTLPPIRKRFFELFFYTHQLYVLFIIFFSLHVGDTYFSRIAGGVFLFMLDRFLRFFQSKKDVDIISATCFPCGSVSLVLAKPKSLHYNALGFVFLRIREISKLQWHPFSVSSSPQDGKYHLSVLIKAVGSWTNKLMHNISNQEQNQSELTFPCPAKITANVEGPYGHESPYHLMYEKLILVAGGSGISPFIAILSDILHRVKDDKPCRPRQVLLIWAIKRSSEVSLLSTLDIKAIHPILSDLLQVEIKIFVTQELEPSLEEGRAQNVVLSSSSASSRGHSMSVLVGTGHILWSGAYIVVPILGFLLLLGLLDVFYLNPYDISKWWYRGILLLICMTVSVLIFGGVVIALWQAWEKRTLSREEDDKAEETLGLMLQNEGLPTKDVIQDYASFTSLSYGHRPNFKDIFQSISESWGNVDIGVIVCGPQMLQSSVAGECRSQDVRRRGSGPIFHFNSHSFDL